MYDGLILADNVCFNSECFKFFLFCSLFHLTYAEACDKLFLTTFMGLFFFIIFLLKNANAVSVKVCHVMHIWFDM